LTCLISGLGDPRIAGAVPGLVLGDGGLCVDGSQFPCCGGKGTRLSPDRETTFMCSLSTRLGATRAAVAPYYREALDPEKFPLDQALKHVPAAALERLALVAAGKTTRGIVLPAAATPPAPALAPPPVWAVAAASAWRFGLPSHVVVIGRTPNARLLPARGESPKVICVEHSERPWDAPHVDAFEMVVGYAYAAMVPLFLVLPPQAVAAAEPSRSGARSLKRAMAERVGRARDRSPLAWLAADAKAKLDGVTDGLPKSKDSKGTRAPKGGVPLPWDL
jgi:hypothetical protein